MVTAFTNLCDVGDRFQNALTLVDVKASDQPLVYVNRAFCELTGYETDEILGLNCRFLQGPETAKEDVTLIRTAIANGQALYCDLLNYRKNRQPFYNRLVLLPLKLDTGSYFVGMQIDATPLLSQALRRGKSYGDRQTTEVIRDRVNTPLMKITTAWTMCDDLETRERILIRSFEQIRDTVRALPLRGDV